MKVRLTPRAVREAKRRKTWWLANRPEAPSLFDRELASAVALLEGSPHAGVIYPSDEGGQTIFRLLLRRTGTHLYYAIEGDEVRVLSLWGARKARPPRLSRSR